MQIAIIGAGYVGAVTGAGLAELGHQVILVDNDAAKIASFREGNVPIYEPGLRELLARNVAAGRMEFAAEIGPAVEVSRVVFIAVGTPPRKDGEADLSAIEAVCRDVGRSLAAYQVIVEKSTVPVNTCENIRRVIGLNATGAADWDLVSNPEFLREGSALADFFQPDRIVVGAEGERARSAMQELYQPLTSGEYARRAGLPGPPPRLLLTDIKSAELIKHASNAFLAMKISFINAVSVITELSGANISDVAEGLGLDRRIGGDFLRASLGYGGSCFPKDLRAFFHIAEQLGYDFRLLKDVETINEDQKARFARKIRRAVWNLSGKNVAVLGLAFKPDTDDVRESPAIDVIQELQQEGACVRAYDPKAMEQARRILPDIGYCADSYEAVEDADCLVICTDWKEFRELDLDRVRSLMRYPIVVDGRNCFDPAAMAARGFHYSSIGRAPVEPSRKPQVTAET